MTDFSHTVGDARKRLGPDVTHRYALEVKWDETALLGLPTLIGPFETEQDALDFIRTSVPNGEATIRNLAYPYSRSA